MERTNDTKQMRQYTVRDNEQTLDFTGVLLAEKDSRVQTKNRWIELRLYRTQAGSYVLEGIGRTTVPGEIDRCWAQVSDEPELSNVSTCTRKTVNGTFRTLHEHCSCKHHATTRTWRKPTGTSTSPNM
jgi:hypothetical protein